MNLSSPVTVWTLFGVAVAAVCGVGVFLAVHRPNVADDRRYAPRHHGTVPGAVSSSTGPARSFVSADDEWAGAIERIRTGPPPASPPPPEWDFERWQAEQDAWRNQQLADADRIWAALDCGVWADPWWARR